MGLRIKETSNQHTAHSEI